LSRRPFRLLREIALLACALAALAAASWGGYALLAARSRGRSTEGNHPAASSRRGLEERLDRRLGELARAALETTGTRLTSPALLQAVAAVQQRLSAAEQSLETAAGGLQPVEILLLDSPVVNAQAFPGGLIVIYRGLIESLDSPEQLAAVVAHEMAHVRYRDSLAVLRRQLGLSVLLDLVGLPRSGEVLKRLIEQAANIHYSRQVEARADRYALELLAAARLDPGRLADALERIANSAGTRQEQLPQLLRYLDNHPALTDRVKAARARSQELGVNEEPLPVPSGWPAVLAELHTGRSARYLK
jgi:predicted Zn-dependent protease